MRIQCIYICVCGRPGLGFRFACARASQTGGHRRRRRRDVSSSSSQTDGRTVRRRMGAEDDIKGVLGVASQVCFVGTVIAAGRESYGHWLHKTCRLCGGAKVMRCAPCGAKGKLNKPQSGEFNISETTGTFQCMFCSGSGSVKCSKCMGAGGEIGKTFNWVRMVEGTKPFKDLLRNRSFGVLRHRVHAHVERHAELDALTDFMHDRALADDAARDLDRAALKMRRRAEKRATSATHSGSTPSRNVSSASSSSSSSSSSPPVASSS